MECNGVTFPELAWIMEQWGYKIKAEEFESFRAYTQGMFNRRRALIIKSGKSLEAIIFYFLTNDFEMIYKKGTWDIPEDNPAGSQIYLDKMICRRWNKQIRNVVKEAIETKFPCVLEGVYHRAPFDRCVKIMTEYGKKEAFFYSKI